MAARHCSHSYTFIVSVLKTHLTTKQQLRARQRHVTTRDGGGVRAHTLMKAAIISAVWGISVRCYKAVYK